MVYFCQDCGFLFQRVSEVYECPSCEGHRFRPATQDESQRLQCLLAQESDTQGDHTLPNSIN